jgi:hypothetical protein
MKPVKEKTKMKKLLIIFAVLCLAAPAMAADWNFFGSARFATFWVDDDPGITQPFETAELQWEQQGNSRIGANVKVNDQIGGGFEMSDSFGKRKLFGTYTFGNGSQLLIGQTYTPLDIFYSDSVFDGDGDLLGIGSFYTGRLPMIQWKMGGFKVALVEPNTTGAVINEDYLATVTDANSYSQLPKIEANYKFSGDMFFINVGAGYNSLEFQWIDAVGQKEASIDSYVVAAGGGLNFGAFYANLHGHMGQNLGNYGAYNPMEGSWGRGDNDAIAIDENGTLRDNDGYGFLGVLGFKASDMFNIEAGYGFVSYEIDDPTTDKDETQQMYLNCTINIAPGFFIVPEIGKIDFKDDPLRAEQGDVTYLGAKWQINF